MKGVWPPSWPRPHINCRHTNGLLSLADLRTLDRNASDDGTAHYGTAVPEGQLKASLISLNRRIGRLERTLDVAVVVVSIAGGLWLVGWF